MSNVMRLTCLVFLFISGLNAELKNVNPDPNGEPWYVGGVVWDEKEMEWYNSLPVFVPSPNSNPEDLPNAVDNSEWPYFRSIFNQQNGSCAQASTIGYTFTYEINRLLRRDVLNSEGKDIETNVFPTHFTYNYWNKGNGSNGSYISNAVSTSREFGVPDCSIWREVTREAAKPFVNPPRWESPMGGNVVQWMTGYDRYRTAMSNRTIRAEGFSNVQDPDGSGLTVLKQYLYDHGADDTATGGGLAVFIMNFTNIEYGIYPAGSPDEGKPFIKDTYGDIDHAMTIVGYNNLVEYDYDTEYDGDGSLLPPSNFYANGTQKPLVDWEKGALIIANSHGKTWPLVGENRDPGFCYLPYRLLAETWGNKYKIQEITRIAVEPEVKPEMAYKVTVDHSNRKLLRCETLGVSDDINAIYPNVGSRIVSFQGGEDKDTSLDFDILPMQGYNSEPLEFGYDLTENIGYLAGAAPIKYFLTFREVSDTYDGNNQYDGVINSFTLIDYRNNNELHIKHPSENIPVGQQRELTMLYDILTGRIEENTHVQESFNIGIPENTHLANSCNFTTGRSVKFFLHNTDFVVDEKSTLTLNYRTVFNGFSEDSQDRIVNNSVMNILSSIHLNNCELLLKEGSYSQINAINLNNGSVLNVENNAVIDTGTNTIIRIDGNASFAGVIRATANYDIEIRDNSTLSLKTLCDFTVLQGSRLSLGNNSKLIVENGSNLMFESGAIVELAEGSEIVVLNKGDLISSGAIFTYTGTSGNWLGINAENGSSVDLNDVTVYNAETGIRGIGNYMFNVTNSVFENCVNGIDVSGMVPGYKYTITGNKLTGNNGGTGISVTSSEATTAFENNEVRGFYTGVRFVHCAPVFRRNIVENNVFYGLRISGQSSIPHLIDDEPDVQNQLNNSIINNATTSISTKSLTGPGQIGISPYASVYMQNGRNNVYSGEPDTTPSVPCIEIDQMTGPHANDIIIQAEGNYWGSYRVTDNFFSDHIHYTIDYSPWSLNPFGDGGSDPLLTPQRKLLGNAISLEEKGNYTAANKIYEVLLKRFRNSPEYFVTLTRLPSLYEKAGIDDSSLIAMFDSEIGSEDITNKKFFKSMKVSAHILSKRYDPAIDVAQEMKSEAEYEEEIILADINIAIANMLKDMENEGKGWKSGTDHSATLSALLSKLNGNGGTINSPSDITESTLPSQHELFQNYPNPFNPVTQIKFALAKTADVKLSVYNINGQQVAQLANGFRQAGVHNVGFDGSKFNSGVYYYTLEVEGKSLTQKMILMK